MLFLAVYEYTSTQGSLLLLRYCNLLAFFLVLLFSTIDSVLVETISLSHSFSWIILVHQPSSNFFLVCEATCPLAISQCWTFWSHAVDVGEYAKQHLGVLCSPKHWVYHVSHYQRPLQTRLCFYLVFLRPVCTACSLPIIPYCLGCFGFLGFGDFG